MLSFQHDSQSARSQWLVCSGPGGRNTPKAPTVDLLPLDPGDWLDMEDRAALHRAIASTQKDLEGGRLIDAE